VTQQNNENREKTREIRVFLSSTFRDMDAERTYLVKQVFPKVRAACLERQVGFSEIDLRWGVSEEESKNGATVEICLKEIDRCRDFPPFFIGFLGERYGWIPRHDELAAYWDKHGDSQYAPAIRDSIERGISVTELEMELAVLGEGAADKMAGHALFLLRAPQLTDQLYRQATGHAPDPNDASYYDAANGRLATLKQRIRHTPYLGIDNYTSIDQFGAAVETYLLAQLDRYFPADEVPTPFERTNAAHQAFRFHRLQNFLPRPDVREQMIQAIAQRIETPALGPILVTGPSGQGKSALMADLARHLQHQPVASQPEASQPEASQPLPPHRGKVGMGVSNPIETNAPAGTNPSTPSPTLPLPGGGSEKKAETWRVIDHYIGADSANYLESWVERILQTLHPDIQDIAGDIPETPKDKIEALSTWISMAARRNHCRYLFILDALDQLSDGGKNLDILTPQTLGPDGILIASAADNTPARSTTKDWNTILEVPPLTDQLRNQIVTDTLARYRKVLPADLANRLASAPQSGSPLYLGLALEELRVDARHENLAQLIDDILKQPDAEQLFLNNFLLDADNGRPELPELAANFMALLGASRAGLSEIELADLLAQPNGHARSPHSNLPPPAGEGANESLRDFYLGDPIAEDTGKPRLPQVHLSRLLNNLAPFLLNKQGRRAPMHRIFGEAALHYYGTWPVREHLYAHFAPWYGKGENEYNARGAAEALHQITEISRNDSKQRNRLFDDLAHLPTPARLHDQEEDLLFDAFLPFSHEDKSSLGEKWVAQAESLLGHDIQEWGGAVGDYALWIRERLGHYPSARKLQEKVLAAHRRILGEEHPHTLMSMDNLAGTLRAQGDLPGARALQEKVLEARRRILGEEHPDTLASMNNLAVTLGDQGDLAGARALKEKVLEASRRILGEEHPDTLTSMNNLAATLGDQGDLAGARALEEKVLEARRRILGEEHPGTFRCMNNLASTLYAQGDLMGARALEEQVLEARRRILGEEHLDTLRSMGNLAATLYNQSDLPGARALQEKVLEARRRILGEEHADTVQARDNLNSTIRKLQDIERRNKRSSSTNQGESTMSTMRITDVIVQWLEMQEWEERPEVDEENQTSSTGFDHSVNDDFSVTGYLDAAEKAGFIKLFMYFNDTKIPASKIDEVIKFVNLVNVGIPIGLLAVIPSKKVLRFYAAIDVEEAALEPRHISNLMGAGLRTMERRLPQFMAICFGGKTAEEALEIEPEE